jgi:hypothetical protein
MTLAQRRSGRLDSAVCPRIRYVFDADAAVQYETPIRSAILSPCAGAEMESQQQPCPNSVRVQPECRIKPMNNRSRTVDRHDCAKQWT